MNKMTRIEFIKFLRRRYYQFFEHIPEDDTIKEYCFILKPEWDFDRLMELFLNEFDNMRTPPPANYFKRYEGKVKTYLFTPDSMSEEKKNALIEVTEYYNSNAWQRDRTEKTVVPDTVRLLENKYKITPEMINSFMTSKEFLDRGREKAEI